MVDCAPQTQMHMAMAALGAPLRQSGSSIWGPFDAHSWSDSAPSGAMPVGGESNTEAAQVAWYVSCVPYLRNSVEKPLASALRYAVHLTRESSIANGLYQQLSKVAGNIHIREVENQMKCRVEEIDVQLSTGTQRMDPYCYKQLRSILETSVRAHVDWLDAALASMQGMDATQRTLSTSEAMKTVRSALSSELSRMLLDRNITTMDMVQRLSSLSANYGSAHVDCVKVKLRCDQHAINLLQKFCFLADMPTKQSEFFHSHDQDLAHFLCFPPTCFTHYLKMHSVSTDDIRSVLMPIANSEPSMASPIPPASMSVVLSMMQRWARANRSVVQEACVDSINSINYMLTLPYTHPLWAGVKVCRERDGVESQSWSQNTDPVRKTWISPPHLEFDHRELVCFSKTHFGVRACRLFAAVLEEVKLGLLPTMTFRASSLLTIVSRFTSDREVSYQQLVNDQLKSIAVECDKPWPEHASPLRRRAAKRSASPTTIPIVYPTRIDADAAGNAAASGASWSVARYPDRPGCADRPDCADRPGCAEPMAKVTVGSSVVPLELKRDHMIMSAISARMSSIKDESVRSLICVDDVVTVIRSLYADMRDKSDSSLRQMVAHVCKHLVDRCHKSGPEMQSELSYVNTRDTAACKKASGISYSTKGGAYLRQMVAMTVWQMRHNGHEFAGKWHGGPGGVTYARKVAKTLLGSGEK